MACWMWPVFELNLYGIEIWDCRQRSSPKPSFELNLYGIEMKIPFMLTWINFLFELNLYGIEIFWLVQEGFQVYQFELNLYGIEIRYWHEGLNLQHYVWIEPLWNWNSSCAIFLYSSVWVWIEPLWNWNCGLFKPRCPLSECLNWTFMELKFPISLSSSSRSCCLNWTFMELKYLH